MINEYFSHTNEYLLFDDDFFPNKYITEIISIIQKIGLNIFQNIKKNNVFFPQWYQKLLLFFPFGKAKTSVQMYVRQNKHLQ